MSILLGCIADDFTGATDLANTLTRQGMATVVLLGVPRDDLHVPEVDAVVIALKSRSMRADDAVRLSLAALSWLQRAKTRQFYFKYCSTFDSTAAGNIGPVAEALLAALGAPFTIACPAFPTNGRTVYQGYLFVGDVLLSESSMRHHPLTPMTDPSLVRVLQRQSVGRVGLIAHEVVRQGSAAIRGDVQRLTAGGVRIAIADALSDADLIALGDACADDKLLTGGSGLALGLPENFRRAGVLQTRASAALPAIAGSAAVLAGSCSAATQRQVAVMKRQCDSFELDPIELRMRDDVVQQALAWACPRLGERPVLIYSTADAAAVAKAQAAVGRERAGELIEQAMGAIAKGLVAAGARRLVVAGGETSGAVMTALGVEGLKIGPEIDPGVPWTVSLGARPLALALKSGNFGSDDFFMKALGNP
ncbi:MAG TPA: 3-oxo-tetronate kinase [Burkholderiales bacterium]|nr:3-oxo-tetronate kinase [Burkholderiales bacterium]